MVLMARFAASLTISSVRVETTVEFEGELVSIADVSLRSEDK